MADASSRPPSFLLLNAENRPAPDELTGAHDLMEKFGLTAKYNQIQTAVPPASITETYLARVVGDSQLRKGPGMDLAPLAMEVDSGESVALRPFDMAALARAFTFAPGEYVLDESLRGTPVFGVPAGGLTDPEAEKRAKKERKKAKKEKKEKKRKEQEAAATGGGV